MRALFLLFPVLVGAQSLMVYSDAALIDKNGRVTAPAMPREILSPALARNAFTSFQVVVDAAPDLHWRLFVGQNPEDAVRLTLYRVENAAYIKPVELPVEGDGTQVFWMDLWTDRNAPVARIKVEPELYIKDDWVTYPMEARVMEATVPDGLPKAVSYPPGLAMKNYLCEPDMSFLTSEDGLWRLQYRNVLQDLALAARVPKGDLRNIYGSCENPTPENPEWYLRIRDYLFRLR